MYGKINYIDFTTASLKNDLEFRYDPMGNRTMKIEYASTGAKYTFYSRDAQGNIMATYTMTDDANDYVYLDEFDIYGSSRLGVNNIGKKMTELTWSGSSFSFTTGNKQYELTNHLGNVLATISDHKLPFSSNVNDGTVDYFLADITSSQDYYPFGMIMPERNWNSSTYRFGFNGQEMDNEISGLTGTHTTAMFWEYDSRLGRRWNLDPVVKEYESPYLCFSANPIWFSDPAGDNAKNPDNIHIYEDKDENGNKMTREETDETSNTYYYHHTDGTIENMGTYQKSNNGKGNKVDLSTSDYIIFNKPFTMKNEPFIDEIAAGALFGALMEYRKTSGDNNYRLETTQLQGENGWHSKGVYSSAMADIRFVRNGGNKNLVNGNVNLGFTEADPEFNYDRSLLLRIAFTNWGFSDIITCKLNNPSVVVLPGTRALEKHYDHMHLQGFHLSVGIYTPKLTPLEPHNLDRGQTAVPE